MACNNGITKVETYPKTYGSISIGVKSFEYVMGVQGSICKKGKGYSKIDFVTFTLHRVWENC